MKEGGQGRGLAEAEPKGGGETAVGGNNDRGNQGGNSRSLFVGVSSRPLTGPLSMPALPNNGAEAAGGSVAGSGEAAGVSAMVGHGGTGLGANMKKRLDYLGQQVAGSSFVSYKRPRRVNAERQDVDMGEMKDDDEALERLLPAPAPVAMQGSPARPPLPSFGWPHMKKAPPLEGGKSVRQRLNEFVQEPAQEGLQKDGLLLSYLKSLP